jgi:hypothetical protein
LAVRSVRLGTGVTTTPNVLHLAYTCPAGRTAIVKDIRCAKNVGGLSTIAIGVRSGPSTIWIINQADVAGSSVFGQPWVVLEPGDDLVAFSNVANAWAYYISGTELEGVAP